MTKIVASIRIDRPMSAVFDYVTTPANWPSWHPASRRVTGAIDHSLVMGEQVTEEFIAGGQAASCVWHVMRRRPPYLWKIVTVTPQISAEITYRLKPLGKGGTYFERELIYRPTGLWFRVLDFFAMRRRNRQESRLALERLKERLEQSSAV
jgi:uncharacterized protein YndB with AHSA1/START domain